MALRLVPITPLEPFYAHPRVQGLAEMMNYVGVIRGAKAPSKKLWQPKATTKKLTDTPPAHRPPTRAENTQKRRKLGDRR